MSTSAKRIGPFLAVAVGLVLGGCANFAPSPLAMKTQVEPVMRTSGAPLTPETHYKVGRVAMAIGDVGSARKQFELALLLDPSFIDAINGLAAILTVQGRYGDSLALMRQIVARDPGNDMYRRNLARVESLVMTSQASEAIAAADSPLPAPAAPTQSPAVVTLPATSPGARVIAGDGPENTIRQLIASDHGAPPVPASHAALVKIGPNVYELQAATQVASATVPVAVTEPAVDPASFASAVAAARESLAARRARTMAMSETSMAPLGRPVAGGLEKVGPSATQSPADGGGKIGSSGSFNLVAYSAPKPPVTVNAAVNLPSPRVMVSNGMGREGWAARHARMLTQQGITPVRITNYETFNVDRTRIVYREGRRADAERILGALPTTHGADLVESGDLPGNIDLRLILGKDSGTSVLPGTV